MCVNILCLTQRKQPDVIPFQNKNKILGFHICFNNLDILLTVFGVMF